MRKVKLYIAISLNGMIARGNGDVSWLDEVPNPDKSDYGYADFYNSIDITIQGFNTYQHVANMGVGNPYPNSKNYVFTRKKDLPELSGFEFINQDHIGLVDRLVKEEGKDIWLIGGSQLNTLFLNEQLIDEIWLFMMPIIIQGGIPLFQENTSVCNLNLLDTIQYSSGVVCMKYEIKKSKHL